MEKCTKKVSTRDDTTTSQVHIIIHDARVSKSRSPGFISDKGAIHSLIYGDVSDILLKRGMNTAMEEAGLFLKFDAPASQEIHFLLKSILKN